LFGKIDSAPSTFLAAFALNVLLNAHLYAVSCGFAAHFALISSKNHDSAESYKI